MHKYWTVRAAAAAVVAVAGVVIPLRLAATAPAATCSPTLQKAALSPASLPGGASSVLTATLSCAPSRAVTVGVKAFTGVQVSSALQVAAGKASGSVTIVTATTKAAHRGWIVATLGSGRQQALLTIGVTPKTCPSPALASATLPALAYVGDHPVLAVKLSCTAGIAARLSLTSSDANLPVPATVTINKYYSAANIVLTPKANPLGQYQPTITVRSAGKTLSRPITVNPGLRLFALDPVSGSTNNYSPDILFTGSLPAGGVVVKLKSDNPAITVPATVAYTQPSSLGGGFLGMKIQTVTENTKVTLSATLGSVTLTASVTLIPPWVPGQPTGQPSSQPPGQTIRLTPDWGSGPLYGPTVVHSIDVHLSNPADPQGSGLVGTVTTDHPDAMQLDGSFVNISPGWSDTSISFDVRYATAPVHATITVTIDGVVLSAMVTIEPSIAAVTAPAAIVGGQPATGTVTLAGPPDQDDTVYLQSTWGILRVPDSVTIPAGQTSATFPVTTSVVDSDSQVSISASHMIGASERADSVGFGPIDVSPPAS